MPFGGEGADDLVQDDDAEFGELGAASVVIDGARSILKTLLSLWISAGHELESTVAVEDVVGPVFVWHLMQLGSTCFDGGF